ncbi:MAG: rod shape-determining protein MreC [Oscillospiraceae bacterium]|nr:rod shape-determining protein MreC [Oscillospiraceae bacterium]
MKKYLKQYGLRLAVLIVAAALVVGLATGGRSDGTAGPLSGLSNSLRIPIQGAVGSVVDWMRGIYGYIYQYDKLAAENESLRKDLAEARQQVRESQDAAEENVRLRTLLGYLEKNTSFVTESARIISWDASNWTSAFTISKGAKNGIEMGDCVITESGMLVGQIMDLGDSWATVRSVIDVNMGAGVLVGEGSIAAMLVGDYALMQDGKCKLSYFTEDVTLFAGDDIITSGSGGAFPSGITVGKVIELRSEAGGQSMYAVVDPAVDLSTLSQVFIIKDFEVIE